MVCDVKCHFCRTPLPEPGNSHVIFAGNERLPEFEPYPVCVQCLKFHKLVPRKLISGATLQRAETGPLRPPGAP